MEPKFDLEAKPLARAIVSHAVRSMDPAAVTKAGRGPISHEDLLQLGITRIAVDIPEKALLLLGRNTLSSSSILPGDAPIVIGFSLFLMIGITQALSKEGITIDARELTDQVIGRHLDQKMKKAGSDQAAKEETLEISRTAARIPAQIVQTAKGEVEDLFSRCYSAIPAYVLGDEEARVQLMTLFGTTLHVLLHSKVEPDPGFPSD